ncbi:unnamed protein product, partial [Pleuronectes platessa]
MQSGVDELGVRFDNVLDVDWTPSVRSTVRKHTHRYGCAEGAIDASTPADARALALSQGSRVCKKTAHVDVRSRDHLCRRHNCAKRLGVFEKRPERSRAAYQAASRGATRRAAIIRIVCKVPCVSVRVHLGARGTGRRNGTFPEWRRREEGNSHQQTNCASPRTTAGTDSTTAGFSNISSGSSSSSGGGGGGGNSGETGGKRDLNQTIHSRIKRRTLSVDFAVPSLLRNYLAEFIKRPLNGDCQTFRGCYTVSANLKMHCIPLQKTVSTFVEPRSAAAASAPRNGSADGQLPFFYKRPLSKVLKLGLTKDSRNSNLVVVEIGEDIVKTGCGGLSVYEEAPEFTLEMDLTSVMEGWLGAEGGRLRVRLMPEKKAQVPGIEDRYTSAIRAADPRLFLQISSQ